MAQRDSKTLILAVVGLWSSFCLAEEVLVAVANNFHRPAQIVAAHFQQQTDHQIVLSTGSTGQIYSQITHGAPYDVFLSADQKRPALLVQKQIAKEPITYAKGRLVLWSPDKALFSDGRQALVFGGFEHIAVANPKLAPYGMASIQVMESLGVYPQLESKLVMGKGLNATYQYLVTGNAELGFLAMSQVLQDGGLLEGAHWLIPDRLYDPIKQDAVLLKHGYGNSGAKAFMTYLMSPEAKEIIQELGYY